MSLILDGTNGLSDIDGSAATPAIRGTDANTGIFFPAADQVAITTGGTQRAVVDASGNVGIGLTPPTGSGSYRSVNVGAAFIYGNTGTAIAAFQNNGDINDKYIINGFASTYVQSSGNHIWYGAASGTAGAAISYTERARIDSSGNLLVGTTTANPHSSGTYGSQLSVGGALIGVNNSHAIIAARYNGDGEVIRLQRNNTDVGSIDVTTTATSYNTSSDYRLKNTIAPMTNALAKVALLKPCTYKWSVDGSYGEGFIAHELAEVCPQAVTGAKDDLDADGKPQYQGIDVSFLVATLTAAIQEQQAIIESLKARLDAANL
jgi:hypothetical protein